MPDSTEEAGRKGIMGRLGLDEDPIMLRTNILYSRKEQRGPCCVYT